MYKDGNITRVMLEAIKAFEIALIGLGLKA
jgi:hypothetical protein